MTSLPQNNSLIFKILVLCLSAISALACLLIFLFAQFVHYTSIPANANTTNGKVVSYKYIGSGDKYRSGHFECLVVYRVGVVSFNKDSGCPAFSGVGDEVTVYYNPKNPTDSHIDARNIGNICGVLALVLGGVSAFWFIVMRRKMEQPAEELESENAVKPLSISGS